MCVVTANFCNYVIFKVKIIGESDGRSNGISRKNLRFKFGGESFIRFKFLSSTCSHNNRGTRMV